MEFSNYHPAINFIFFIGIITSTLQANNPVYVLISLAGALAYFIKLKGLKGLFCSLIILAAVPVYCLFYGFYNHFGLTVIGENFAGNMMTMEAHLYGLVIGLKAASVIIWFLCIWCVISSDKVVYMLGRFSPNLSLIVCAAICQIPQIYRIYKDKSMARKSLPKGRRSLLLVRRITGFVNILYGAISQWIDNIFLLTESMNSRGYKLKGRTSYSIYRFDTRDRAFVIVMVILLTLMAMSMALGETRILYDPELIIRPFNTTSYIFAAAYAMLAVMPFAADTAWQISCSKSIKSYAKIK